jgi:IPT/TIG domain-containing protein
MNNNFASTGGRVRPNRLLRLGYFFCVFTLLLIISASVTKAQYVIGVSAISANASAVDTYSATELDPVANYYYDAYVEGYLYKKPPTSLFWSLIRSGAAHSGNDPSDPENYIAYGYMNAPTEIRSSYQIESDHYVVAYFYYYDPYIGSYVYQNPARWGLAEQDDPWLPTGYQFLPSQGQEYVLTEYIYLGTTGVGLSTSPPVIEEIQPAGAVRGNNGYLAVWGSHMLGTTLAQLTGSGASISPVYVSENQVNLSFSLTQTAETGARQLRLTNPFGPSNPEDFLIGDPTPRINAISPTVWEVGGQTDVVINGTGFGTQPSVVITGSGISISILSVSDTQIRCRFAIDNTAPEGNRTVTVLSNGYGGNPFISAPVQVPGEWPPTTNSTPNSNGVAFTVVTPTVTFQQFNSIIVGGSRQINVNVNSMLPGRRVDINIRSNSGGATFVANNSTVLNVGVGNTTLDVRGNVLSQSVDGVSLTAEFGPKKFEEKFTVVILKLKEVSFSGSGNRTLRKDNNSGNYTAPHWVDNSSVPNGNADDPGDIKYPVAYIKNNTVTTAIKVVAVPDVSLDGVTVKVKGDAFPNLSFAEKTVTAGASARDISISGFVSVANLSTTVDYFAQLFIHWQYQPPNTSSWWLAGSSSNQVYVTWAAPVTISPLFHTLAHIACKPAKGMNTEADIFNAIWGKFALRQIYKADDTTQLKYYHPKDTQNVYPSELIAAGNGQCGSFARLLIDSLRVHGISTATFPIVESAISGGFLVKVWTFTTLPGKSGDSSFPYLNVIRDQIAIRIEETFNSAVHSYSYAQAKDEPGFPGQGSPDPSSIFGNHQFVQYNGKWYDPSYGSTYPGTTITERLASVEAALDGLSELRLMTISEASIDTDLNGNGTKTDVLPDIYCLVTNKKPTTAFLIHAFQPWP